MSVILIVCFSRPSLITFFTKCKILLQFFIGMIDSFASSISWSLFLLITIKLYAGKSLSAVLVSVTTCSDIKTIYTILVFVLTHSHTQIALMSCNPVLPKTILAILWSTESVEESTIDILACNSAHTTVCIEFGDVVLCSFRERCPTDELHTVFVDDICLESLLICTASYLWTILSDEHNAHILASTAGIATCCTVMIATELNLFYATMTSANFRRFLMMEASSRGIILNHFVVWALIWVTKFIIYVMICLLSIRGIGMRAANSSGVPIALRHWCKIVLVTAGLVAGLS